MIQHPDGLYGVDNREESNENGETIANSKFQYSNFREEDSKIFHQVLKQYYSFLTLFHGKLRMAVDHHT